MLDYGQNDEIAVLIGTLYFIGRVPRHSKVPPPTFVSFLRNKNIFEETVLVCPFRQNLTQVSARCCPFGPFPVAPLRPHSSQILFVNCHLKSFLKHKSLLLELNFSSCSLNLDDDLITCMRLIPTALDSPSSIPTPPNLGHLPFN